MAGAGWIRGAHIDRWLRWLRRMGLGPIHHLTFIMQLDRRMDTFDGLVGCYGVSVTGYWHPPHEHLGYDLEIIGPHLSSPTSSNSTSEAGSAHIKIRDPERCKAGFHCLQRAAPIGVRRMMCLSLLYLVKS